MPFPRPIPLIAVLLNLLAVVESGAAPPVLNRLSLPSPMADVSAGQVQLPIEIDFSAPEGISRVEMRFLTAAGDAFYDYVSPTLEEFSITGTAKAGIYRGDLVIPGFRPADTWTISATLFDKAGGSTDYPVLPDGSSLTLTTLNSSGPVDLLPPVLTSAVLTPGTVDISSAPQSVMFTITAQDDAGIEALEIDLEDPTGRYRGGDYLTALERIAGTAQSVTWQGSFTVPAFGPAGSYKVSYWLHDQSRRYSYHGSESAPDPNIATTLTVITSGPVDTAGPVLTAISASRQEVDVTDGAQTVRLDLSAMDAPGGIRSIHAVLFSPDGNGARENAYYDESAPYTTEPVASSMEFTIPRYTLPGLYRWMVGMLDGVDFETSYGSGELPFPGEFSGTLLVVNNGLTRGTPPVATGFTISPSTLPEAGLPGLVEYTVQINDPSAVTYVNAFFFDSSGRRDEFPLKLIGGTAQNGTWQGRFRISRARLPGDYRTGFRINDETGDSATYGTYPYTAFIPYPAGWPVNFTITPGGTPLTAYQTWHLAYPGLADAGAESDDPDGDGWPNALEFICGMDPLSSSTKGLDDRSNGPGTPRIQWHGSGTFMEYYLSLPNMAMGSGTNLKIKGWKSDTLAPGSWQPMSPFSSGSEHRYLRLDVPSYSRKQQFLRLTVEP